MEKQEHNVRLDAVFIDTNLLIKLQNGDGNADFLRLRELAERSSVDLLVPEIVLYELTAHSIEQIHDSHRRMKNDSKLIADLLNCSPIHVEKIDGVATKATNCTMKIIKKWGIGIANLPEVDLKALIAMSVNHIPPFEQNDKGFKDALIVETVLEDAKKRGLSSIFFISADKIFKREEISNRFKESDISLLVLNSFSAAHDELNALIDVEIRSLISEEEKRIRTFLEANKVNLFQYVISNASFNSREIEGTGPLSFLAPVEKPIFGNVLEIKSKRPISIASFHRGWLYGEVPLADTEEPISITVDIEIDLLVEQYPLRNTLFGGDPFDDQGRRVRDNSTPFSPTIRDDVVVRQKTVIAAMAMNEGVPISIKFIRVI